MFGIHIRKNLESRIARSDFRLLSELEIHDVCGGFGSGYGSGGGGSPGETMTVGGVSYTQNTEKNYWYLTDAGDQGSGYRYVVDSESYYYGQMVPVNTPEPRKDEANKEEILFERQFLIDGNFADGSFADAELVNGEWVIKGTDAPTIDQIHFKNNWDGVSGSLWGNLSHYQQMGLASSLTDYNIDIKSQGIDIGDAYLNYKHLLSQGEVSGSTSNDFAAWIAGGGR